MRSPSTRGLDVGSSASRCRSGRPHAGRDALVPRTWLLTSRIPSSRDAGRRPTAEWRRWTAGAAHLVRELRTLVPAAGRAGQRLPLRGKRRSSERPLPPDALGWEVPHRRSRRGRCRNRSLCRIPEPFRHLPDWAVSHSSAHRDLSPFAGKTVLVVGGGQSALESAALLHEEGAHVVVVVRESRIYYLRRVPWLHKLGPITRLLFAPAEVGPAGVSQCVSKPDLYRRLPRRLQTRWVVRSLRPAGAAWLEPRLNDVPILTGTFAGPGPDRRRARPRDAQRRRRPTRRPHPARDRL